jgi:divalent metal cation (Fe/Co/Zn/Cd) transporter
LRYYPSRKARTRKELFKTKNIDQFFIVNCWLFYLILIGFIPLTNDTYSYFNDTAKISNSFAIAEDFCAHKDYAKKHKEVLGVHDIVIHNYGPGRSFSSMHVEVDGKKDIFDTHDVIDNIERELSEMYGIHCAVHLDPIVTDNELVCDTREKVASIVRGYDSSLTLHDFRMVIGPTHSNLIFDLLVPYEYKTPAAEIKAELDKKIKEIDNNYYSVITIDKG